jgi:hypothetical protein
MRKSAYVTALRIVARSAPALVAFARSPPEPNSTMEFPVVPVVAGVSGFIVLGLLSWLLAGLVNSMEKGITSRQYILTTYNPLVLLLTGPYRICRLILRRLVRCAAGATNKRDTKTTAEDVEMGHFEPETFRSVQMGYFEPAPLTRNVQQQHPSGFEGTGMPTYRSYIIDDRAPAGVVGIPHRYVYPPGVGSYVASQNRDTGMATPAALGTTFRDPMRYSRPPRSTKPEESPYSSMRPPREPQAPTGPSDRLDPPEQSDAYHARRPHTGPLRVVNVTPPGYPRRRSVDGLEDVDLN